MNERAPFTASDLEELDACLLSRAERVVPMRDIFKGDTGPRVIALRHDVDDNAGSFACALRMAEWEFEHGYSSTYYLLHTAHYWGDEMLCRVGEFEELGHEVGIHVNAIAAALRQDGDPSRILARALAELRSTGVRVLGCVAHGDRLCYAVDNETLVFVNDEMFAESPRPNLGLADRTLVYRRHQVKLDPIPRSVYGLEYDAARLSRFDYLSDSSGKWSQPVAQVAERFGEGQLHVLLHPDWWREAFAIHAVAA